MSKPTLLTVIGSVRPGRVGRTIGDWFIETARDNGSFNVVEADLADLALPFMDEPNHPRLQRYEHKHTKSWSKVVESADAFVFISPEYNHSFAPALKNAFDYLHQEWLYKPLGFVSYGGIAGGVRGVEQFLPIASIMQMPVPQNLVTIPFFFEKIDENGKFVGDEGMKTAATTMLADLLKLTAVTKAVRA